MQKTDNCVNLNKQDNQDFTLKYITYTFFNMNKIIHFTSKINISCLCAILGILTQTHTYLFSYIFLATYTLLLRTYGRRHRFMLLIYAFFCLYPAILEHHYQTQLDQLKTETTEKTLTLRFLEPLFSNKQGSVLVKDIKNKHIYRLQYRENVFQKQPDYSDIYRSRVSIHFPSPARNPGTRDQRLFFQRKQIYGTLHPSSARFLKTGFQNPIKTLAFRLKRSLLELHGSVLPEPYQDLLTSLIFGTHATRLPFKLQDMFKRTGLTHLLVVSGSQVSLLSGILFVLLTPLKHARKTRFISLAIIQFLFYFLTGGGASIGRAIIMNMILYYCRLFQKKQAPFFGFSTTIVIMLIINPFLLLDIGAQLSFLASFSLVYGVPAITKKLPQKLPFKTAIALSLSPFLFTQPLLIAQFQTVSPISLISNLITLQLIECLVIVGFFSTWIGFFYLPQIGRAHV